MKSIFIIVLFLLVLPRNALFCKGFRGYCKML
nr:MAG TPA: Toxin Ibs, type I toxin-antitoxin system [Bacteriophage sp.]